MPGFLKVSGTPAVIAAQYANGSGPALARMRAADSFDGLTAVEAQFIAARDGFYMATVSETGWPYVQHRGGPPGFLKVLDDRTLAFADFRGNRQYVSLGNLAGDDRAALILMDYANGARLKLFVRVEVRGLAADPELASAVDLPGYRARPERALLLRIEASDWNCKQHIAQRFTLDELAARLEQLEFPRSATRRPPRID
jgi:predicted pyridoxine 5'-phosphate oxidase superfamily flavin-nucleotide-binding protein